MNELTLANNRVLSHIIDQDSLLIYKARVEGYELFNDCYAKSSENNMFKTPVNFTTPTSGPGYQYVAKSKFLSDEFIPYVTNLINTYLDKNFSVADMWYLYQTNDSWVSNPKHTHMTANWVCVTYLDVKENDCIEFYDGETMEEYFPSFGEMLFFLGSTYHKPGANRGSKRLTLNLELTIDYTEEETALFNAWCIENPEILAGLTVAEIHQKVFG